jgi:hypothetical protein
MDHHKDQGTGADEELVYGGGVQRGGGSLGGGKDEPGAATEHMGGASGETGEDTEELVDEAGNMTGGRMGDEIGYAGSDRVVGGDLERSEAEGDAGAMDPRSSGDRGGGAGQTSSMSREGSRTMETSSPTNAGNPAGQSGTPHDALAENLGDEQGNR